ncbi:MAG: HAD hydrolase-like protein [Candidatus Saccharimonadales bacterium]
MSKVVIFDFDGTIADTFPVVLDIFHKVQRRAVPLTKEEEILMRGAALMQVKLRVVIKAAARLDIPFWRLPFVFAISQLLLKKRMNEVQSYPGVAELIKKLASDGDELFIVSTNSTGNIRRFLKSQDLSDHFVKIYGNVRPRNKAKVIRHIVRWRNASPGHVWFVGDEDRDVAAGHAADVPALAVTWGYNDLDQLKQAQPTHTVTSAAELYQLIDKGTHETN